MEPQFKCGTQRWVYNKSEYRYRSPRCYERQLAQHAALLERMLEVVQAVEDERCFVGGESNPDYLFVLKAQALIPDLEKALEKKP